MTLYFQFKEITIQVIPEKDLCFIFKNGFPIWSGDKDKLIDLLNQVVVQEEM